MKASVGILKGFAYVWGSLVALTLVIYLVRLWSIEGFSAIQDTLSPFNLRYYMTAMVALAPAIGAYMWAEKLEK